MEALTVLKSKDTFMLYRVDNGADRKNPRLLNDLMATNRKLMAPTQCNRQA